MRYLEILRHTDTFDIVASEAREAAIRLVLIGATEFPTGNRQFRTSRPPNRPDADETVAAD